MGVSMRGDISGSEGIVVGIVITVTDMRIMKENDFQKRHVRYG